MRTREAATNQRDVELLAVGGEPANLALAVALEELAPELAAHSVIIEQPDDIPWPRGPLYSEAESQVSFLEDLVTPRNPRSKFTFVNYLHSVGRLRDFIDMGGFWPYRQEISQYFRWVASELDRVRLECSPRCVAVEPYRADGQRPGGWLARLADGSAIRSRYIVLATERDSYIPPVFGSVSRRHLIHSSEYRQRIAEIPRGLPYQVVVIGTGRSAAGMFDAVRRDLPHCRRTLVMRTPDLETGENSRSTKELNLPGFMDTFLSAQPSAREQILRHMRTTGYQAPAAPMLGKIHRDLYLDRLAGSGATRIAAMTEVTAAREEKGEVFLVTTDRTTGRAEELRCDLVLLGTGYARELPPVVAGLAGALGLDRIEVTRDGRLKTDAEAAPCYLHGLDEAADSTADSPLGVLAVRAAGITRDILAGRAARPSRHGDHPAADPPRRPGPELSSKEQ